MAGLTPEEHQRLLKAVLKARESNQSEYVHLAEFVDDLLSDGETDAELVDSSLEQFVEAVEFFRRAMAGKGEAK